MLLAAEPSFQPHTWNFECLAVNIKHQERGKIHFNNLSALMYLRHYDLNSQYKMSTICRIRFHIEDLQSGEHLALKFELNVFHHLLTLSGCHGRQHGSRVELRKTCLS